VTPPHLFRSPCPHVVFNLFSVPFSTPWAVIAINLTQDTFQKVMNASSAVSRNCGRTVKKSGQWLRDVAKKWRVRTEGSGVAHGGNVVCNGLKVITG